MIKWADYLISEVRYHDMNLSRHISALKVQQDHGDKMEAAEVWTRQELIKAIDSNKTIFTIIRINESEWKKGARIQKINLLNNCYLKTNSSDLLEDSINDLPEF